MVGEGYVSPIDEKAFPEIHLSKPSPGVLEEIAGITRFVQSSTFEGQQALEITVLTNEGLRTVHFKGPAAVRVPDNIFAYVLTFDLKTREPLSQENRRRAIRINVLEARLDGETLPQVVVAASYLCDNYHDIMDTCRRLDPTR